MDHQKEAERQPNPKEKCSFLSRLTFFFTLDIFNKSDITESDIYRVLPQFQSARVGDELESEWVEETRGNNTPSIYRLLWRCYGRYYFLLGLLQLAMKIIMIVVLPRAQGKLISYFSPNGSTTKNQAVLYGCVVIGLNIVICTYNHNYRFLVTELGIKVRTAFSSLIYRKALKLSSLSQSGKIVTLISKDVLAFENILIFLNDMWIALVIFVIAGCIMYAKVGVAAIGGGLLLMLVIPLEVCLGKLTSRLRIQAAVATDARLQLSQEVLSSIKPIKMHTWENHFTNEILKVRQKEMRRLEQFYFAKAAFVEVGSFVITFIWYVLVFSYTGLGNILTAEIAFFLRECLRALRSPITISLPLGILRSAELTASARRINEFLTSEETKIVQSRAEPLIELQGVDIKISKGVTIITGKLGSGKSSLLKAIQTKSDVATLRGTVSYSDQEPWLFPSTIKQNVIFGQEVDDRRYREVMRVCGLDIDSQSFINGDQTIVDDGGRNFSAGQRARLSLARAVYCDKDIYLIDDCWSSLDVHVQDHIFTECIKKFLGDKIVVVVANNNRFFGRANTVLEVDAGRVRVKNDNQDTDDEDTVTPSGTYPLSDQSSSRNIYHEDQKRGKVSLGVYRRYFRYGGGFVVVFAILGLYATAQTGIGYSEKAISNWVNIQQQLHDLNSTNISLLQKDKQASSLYTLAIATSVVFLIVRTYVFFGFSSRAALALHNSMVKAVITATMDFFDSRYFGNILNRFAKDVCVVDEALPFNIHESLKFLCKMVSIIVLILTVRMDFFIPAVVFVAVLFVIRGVYMPTGRSLQRLDSATRSPVVGYISASLEGLSTIRACGTEEILKREFDRHLDLCVSTMYMNQSTSRAFAYALDMLSNFFIAAVIVRFLVADKDTQAGSVGLAITQALSLPGLFQFGIRQWAELETSMTSVERILEFAKAKTERIPLPASLDKLSGDITYADVCLTYRNSRGPVLNNINFTISSGEKIGIVGRTGAGKSSLVAILMRLYDYEGTVSIGGLNTNIIPLEFLRSNISAISQECALFKGTLRSNVDPLGVHTDDEIFRVANKTQLKSLFESLEAEVELQGSNFSSGEKQLICLVRAMLSDNKIVILDEAAASVDFATETVVRRVVREQFFGCTVITISHKIENVMDSDRVMVVDKGEIVEFDKPGVLLQKQDGVFHKMAIKANFTAS